MREINTNTHTHTHTHTDTHTHARTHAHTHTHTHQQLMAVLQTGQNADQEAVQPSQRSSVLVLQRHIRGARAPMETDARDRAAFGLTACRFPSLSSVCRSSSRQCRFFAARRWRLLGSPITGRRAFASFTPCLVGTSLRTSLQTRGLVSKIAAKCTKCSFIENQHRV